MAPSRHDSMHGLRHVHTTTSIHTQFSINLIRRCIEVVVTRTTRNRFVLSRARGFESHHLRQSGFVRTMSRKVYFAAFIFPNTKRGTYELFEL